MGLSTAPQNAALEAAFSSSQTPRRLALAGLLALCVAGCQAEGEAGVEAPGEQQEIALRNIGSLQGRELRSPYEGREVRVQGVVSANVVNGLGGFFLQDAIGAEDGDLATADAVFVEWAKGKQPKIRRGDRVNLQARVVERGPGKRSMTTLSEARIEVLGRAAVRVTELEQAPRRAEDWEALEGMWVRVVVPLTVVDNRNLLLFGELLAAFEGDVFVPTELHPPGPKSRALAEDNQRRLILIDDARQSRNPERLWFLQAMPNAEQPLRVGSRLQRVEGVIDERYGSRRLQLTSKLTEIEQAPRPAAPDGPDGLRIAAINLHNLFNGNGRGGGFPTSRGAASQAEYRRQRDKLVKQIIQLQPDVAALSEVENDGDDPRSALNDLINELNKRAAAAAVAGDAPSGSAAVAAPTYRAIVDHSVKGDSIRVALLYRADRVETVGEFRSLRREPFDDGGRPPLAQSFRDRSGGPTFTVVANHLKSKGGCPEDDRGDPGNRDQGDGQGCWNQLRVDSARALDAWIKTDPTGSGTPLRLLVGDFNSYSQEDPLRLLRSLGWRDALPGGSESQRRPTSFRYEGRAGRLDHILVSPELQAAVIFADSWPVNSAESPIFGYKSDKDASLYGASDHDPVIAVLDPAKLNNR